LTVFLAQKLRAERVGDEQRSLREVAILLAHAGAGLSPVMTPVMSPETRAA
jgi:hypothetical protein